MKSWRMRMNESGAELDLAQDAPMPTPGEGQMLVRMHAASLNRGEFTPGHGTAPQGAPFKAAGGEGSGEVVALGAGVTGFSIGEKVMGRAQGAFSAYAVMEAAEAMPIPAGIGWEQAASIPLTYLVAYDMLVLQGRLKAGEWLLIVGVSSGVGVASLQIAKALGAQVIGTSGSTAKLDALAALGLDRPIATRAPDFAVAAREATGGRGVDLVINAVGGSMFEEAVRAMAFEGRLATVGHVDNILEARIDLEALHRLRLTFFGVSNKLRSRAQRAAALPRFRAEVLPLFAEGRIAPLIDRVFEFEQLPDALRLMETSGHVGKIVLRAPAG